MNKAVTRSASTTLVLLLAASLSFASAGTSQKNASPNAVPACVGGTSLSGWYGMLVGGSADAGGGKYLSGALNFDGNCNITANNVSGGAGTQYVTTSATGTYGQNSDGTFTITLTPSGQTAQTYIVGVSESGTKARGIEYDNTASATIDLQSQLTSLTNGYSTASLAGAYAVACTGTGVDLNYVTFDGKGNISGVDDYSHGSQVASATYTGTYSVNTDGTFSGSLLGGYSAFTLTGVIDDGLNEIEYTYNQSGNGGVDACVGKVSNSTALSGYYGLLVGGGAVSGGGGKYLSGSLFFNGSGGLTGTNITGGINSTVSTSTATGTYTVNSDNTVTINLILSGQTATQTYVVGVAQGGLEALGIENDGTADATIDLQAQLEPSSLPYSTASLNGTYSVTCSGSEVDLNYVTFDGNGNVSGVDPYASENSQGDNPYTGTYSVNSDGTITSQLSGNYSAFSFTGAIDNWTSEVAYIYQESGNGEVVSCLGESTYGPVGTATVAATPTFNPAPGSFSSSQTVTLADTTPGAKIYYTTNGIPPTVQSPLYSKSLTVSANTTVLAIAVASGYNNSAIGGGTYFFGSSGTQTAATPQFNPLPGSYSSTQSVMLSDTTPGATIYYTTNGTPPNTNSTKYTTAISVSATTTIEAIAVATGYTNSPVATGLYTITGTQTVATPTFSPLPGTYSSTQSVTLSDTTSGASIYYSINGGTPILYSTPITVSTSETLYAAAVETGYNNSAIATGVYTITSGSGTSVNLSKYYNVYGIATSGTDPKNGGFDNDGYAYNSSLLGTSLTYQGINFPLAAANTLDAVVAQTVPVTQAQYGQLLLLGAAVNGAQTNQAVLVYYTDGSFTSFTQNFSDWAIPQNYTGESTVLAMSNRITPTGGTQTGTFNVYGYTFALNSSKTLAAVKLPYNRDVVFLGMGLSGVPTPIVPYIQVNGGSWQQTATATVASGSAVNLGPQPLTGTWSWTGPNGYTSTSRQINSIPLSTGINTYVATYTNSSGVQSTQAFTITVTQGSFTLSASPSSVSLAQGGTGASTLAVTDAGGFNGSVTLAASGLPSGVTAAFATNPTTGSSLVTFTASSTAASGTATVTITGTSGSLTASTPIALTVNKGGFACHVGYQITGEWPNGFQADITIYNTGTVGITSWKLTWTFANSQEIFQLWDGTVSQSGANVTVTNLSYNGTISAGGNYNGVGFNALWNNKTNSVPTSFAVNGTTCN